MPDSGTTSGDAILTVGLRLRSPGLPINRSCSNLHDSFPVGARRVSQMRQDARETADERGCTRRAILHRQAMQMQYHGRSRIVIPYLVTAGRVWGDGRAMRQTDGLVGRDRLVSSKDGPDALLTSPFLFPVVAKRAATAASVAPWDAGLCWYAPFCAVSRWRPAIFPGGSQVLGNVGGLIGPSCRASGQVVKLK